MRRQSKTVMDNLTARAERQRKKMVPIKSLVAAYNGEHWTLICDRLLKKLKVYEAVRSGHENLKSLNDLELKMILAREDEIRTLLSMPEDAQAVLEAMQDVHDNLLAKINAKRQAN